MAAPKDKAERDAILQIFDDNPNLGAQGLRKLIEARDPEKDQLARDRLAQLEANIHAIEQLTGATGYDVIYKIEQMIQERDRLRMALGQ